MSANTLRAVLAVSRRDLRTAARYPAGMINLVVLAPLYQAVLPALLLGSAFAVGGRSPGLDSSAGTSDLAGFLFTGVFVQSLVLGACWGVVLFLTMDRELGTLEQNFLTPLPRHTFVLGSSLACLALSAAGGVLLLGIGAAFFGARYLMGSLLALPVLVLTTVALVGVAYLVAAAVLLFRRIDVIVDGVGSLIVMLSGGLFPISSLPDALRPVALCLPTTHAIDILRVHALGATSLLAPTTTYLLVAIEAVAFLAIGRFVFDRTVRRVEKAGTISQH
jgi:ABC-2 type transport system permease protein